MSLAETLKNHIVIVVLGTAVSSFGVGWSAYKATVEAQGQEPILKTRRAELERAESELGTCRAAQPRGADAATCRTILSQEIEAKYVLRADVQRDYVLRSATVPNAGRQTSFAPGEWRYFQVAKLGGKVVEDRLNQVRPPADGLVIYYDDSANDTFHVWHRGQGAAVVYKYLAGTTDELVDPPARGFFLPSSSRVPAGIGTGGGRGLPIYFEVTAR